MMNRNKAKGSQFERDVARYLNDHGHPHVERAYGAGRPDDRGDLTGFPGFVIECKNAQRLELPAWLAETETERVNANADYGVVVAKRRGHRPATAYVIMTLATFADLTREDL